MREVSSDQGHQEDDLEDSSDVSGYHSDSDSAVMMSGNSPFVSNSARYNFLSRSGKKKYINTNFLLLYLRLFLKSEEDLIIIIYFFTLRVCARPDSLLAFVFFVGYSCF